MSKAFRSDDVPAQEITRPLPVGRRLSTAAGHKALQRALHERLRSLQEQHKAAAQGDAQAQRTLSYAAQQVHVLERTLALTDVAPEVPQRPEQVVFGAQVELFDEEHEQRISYTLVGPDETDIAAKRISVVSPVGLALMGRRVGERVFLKRPAGVLEVVVLAIARPRG